MRLWSMARAHPAVLADFELEIHRCLSRARMIQSVQRQTTGWEAKDLRFNSRCRQQIFLLSKVFRRAVPTGLLLNGHREPSPR
jgi:hypothetical protein